MHTNALKLRCCCNPAFPGGNRTDGPPVLQELSASLDPVVY